MTRNWLTACPYGLGRPALSPCRLLTSLQSGGCSFICCAAFRNLRSSIFRKPGQINPYQPSGGGDARNHRDHCGQRHEGRAHNRNSDWRADDAGSGCRGHLANRKGFHQAFCFGRNASRLQSTGLSRVHKIAKGKSSLPDLEGHLLLLHPPRRPQPLIHWPKAKRRRPLDGVRHAFGNTMSDEVVEPTSPYV
jgi:hypothetical protein